MKAAIIADTHLPRGTRALPACCIERLRGADLIIHAGDLAALSVLAQLREFGEVVAVHGNVDEPEVVTALPSQTELELGRWRLAVIHDAGPRAGRLERMRRRFPRADAVVFGHSHMPLHETAADGFQIFNPGSPTQRRRSPRHTMGIATPGDSHLTFELIELN